MTTIRIDLDDEGIREFLRGNEVRRWVTGIVENIQHAAGEGMKSDVQVSRKGDRVRGMVWTETFDAMRAEAYHRALTRAIDAGRR